MAMADTSSCPETCRAGTSRDGRTVYPSAAPPVPGERKLLDHREKERLGFSCALSRCLSAVIFWSRKRKEVEGRLQTDPDTCLGPASFLHALAKVVLVPALKRQKVILLAVVPLLLRAITEGREWALGP